ncbi:MAG TPA: energy transducer TonB [Gammaproteobacteria bacterium]|nr:energy transducer TonB [Gammaproteobacteria bacterium]
MVSEADGELSRERFRFMVFLSACAHAMLILGVGFTYFGENRDNSSIEVTIAQYRSRITPDDAEFIAQENQAGSGSQSEPTPTSSPFISDFNDAAINEILPAPEAQVPSETPEQTGLTKLSTTNGEPTVAQQRDNPKQEKRQALSEQSTSEELSLAIASLQAQLDFRKQALAQQPRKYTISSASARKSHEASYLDAWRRRVEAVGNINYPIQARQQQVYGNVRMLISINASGQIGETQILQSSGSSLLDQAAVDIVNLAAPFETFPDELKAEADIIDIIRTFRFHEGNTLSSY